MKDFINDIKTRKYIDIYIAILVNIILAILSFLDILSFQILGGAILASLSWLTLNALLERKANKIEMENFLDQIKSSKGVRAKDFFSENYVHNGDDFKKEFSTAHELSVIGMGQMRMIIAYGSEICKLLINGGKVKFVLCDPNSVSTDMSSRLGSTQPNFERNRQEHLSAIERLASIVRETKGKGLLELKFVDILMPYTMYGFDINDNSKGKIYIWLSLFKEPSVNRPGFVLSFHRDQYWFKIFKEQFEKYWEWDESKTSDLKNLDI